ncbi:MAG: hypothetical protein AAGF98_17260 [Cyanobacteria bacterium P01_H01_bin.153]
MRIALKNIGSRVKISVTAFITTPINIMDTSVGFGASKVTEENLVSEATDLFDGFDRETSIIGGRNITFRPFSENVDGPFQWTLTPHGDDQYLQLNSLRLWAESRVVVEENHVNREMTSALLVATMMFIYFAQRELKLQLNWPVKLLLVPLMLFTAWQLAPSETLSYIYFDF